MEHRAKRALLLAGRLSTIAAAIVATEPAAPPVMAATAIHMAQAIIDPCAPAAAGTAAKPSVMGGPCSPAAPSIAAGPCAPAPAKSPSASGVPSVAAGPCAPAAATSPCGPTPVKAGTAKPGPYNPCGPAR